ncbi:uncharacterized protein MAM_06890 [Metarhizium album ARSEF 1941]|uniref:Uncharacterized protein n=1 Tax=Metarhizium album (strain ARSEF 1941) TaxID=1081103 RepID=A0A0B2WNE6_METAS|nr:uncharacterized protein MAM_06890 [Metarhizium album ARSEF 1941]KHN95179.1 hypothetical protein MAM_06890 [Metarhizium album ARSEF 1941]
MLDVTDTRFWTSLFQAMRAGAIRLPISEGGWGVEGKNRGKDRAALEPQLTDCRKHNEKGCLAEDCRNQVDAQPDLDDAGQDVVELAEAERNALDIGAHQGRGGEFSGIALVYGQSLFEYLGHEHPAEQGNQPIVEVVVAGAGDLCSRRDGPDEAVSDADRRVVLAKEADDAPQQQGLAEGEGGIQQARDDDGEKGAEEGQERGSKQRVGRVLIWPGGLEAGGEVLGGKVVAQAAQVVDAQDGPEAEEKGRVEPQEQRAVPEAAGGLLAQGPPQGQVLDVRALGELLQQHEGQLGGGGGGGEGADGVEVRAEEEGARLDDVEEGRQAEVEADEGRGAERVAVLEADGGHDAQRADAHEGEADERGIGARRRQAAPETERGDLEAEEEGQDCLVVLRRVSGLRRSEEGDVQNGMLEKQGEVKVRGQLRPKRVVVCSLASGSGSGSNSNADSNSNCNGPRHEVHGSALELGWAGLGWAELDAGRWTLDAGRDWPGLELVD